MPNRPRTRTRLRVLFAAAGCHDLMAKLMYAHLLPRSAGSTGSIQLGAPIMFYGDVVELLLATAVLLEWYRRGARTLVREKRRRAGSAVRRHRHRDPLPMR